MAPGSSRGIYPSDWPISCLVRAFYTILDRVWRRKVPWSSAIDFGPSKAEEAGPNHNYSTTTSLRKPRGILAAFIQATGPSVDLFVHFIPIWTTKCNLELRKLILNLQRQRRPAKTITIALPLYPDGPRIFLWHLHKRLAHQLTCSCSLHQFGPRLAPKSTLSSAF